MFIPSGRQTLRTYLWKVPCCPLATPSLQAFGWGMDGEEALMLVKHCSALARAVLAANARQSGTGAMRKKGSATLARPFA